MSIACRSCLAVSAILMFLAACATSPSATSTGNETPGTAASSAGDRADDAIIPVEVNHDRFGAGTATIYIQPASGVRSTLGTISSGETKVFSYRVESANRNVTLSALDASGQTVTSRQITVPRGAGLVWSLQVNSIRVKSGG